MNINSVPFNTVYNLRQFDPAVEKPGTFGTETQLNDLAVVEQPQITTPASSLSPIVVFNNPGDVTAFFAMLKNQTITLSGQSSPQGVTGTFASATVAGQFNGSFPQTGQEGDSGGSASVQNQAGTNYVVGITVAGSAVQHKEIFSYLTMQDYDAASAIAQSQDYSGMAPDLLIGHDGAVMRGWQRKADIITNGDNNIILAGSGGGLINTGVGNNDVIFMPSAAGQTDPGTTVVVSPGTSTIVGGGPNDKLVLLADRLTPAGGSATTDASDTSDTIQLTGGYNFSNDDSAYGYDSRIETVGGDGQQVPDGDDGSYDYGVNYIRQGNDLLVLAHSEQFSPDGGSGDVSGWDGSVTIKDFRDGDFGIHLTKTNDFAGVIDGTETMRQFVDIENQDMHSLAAMPQSSSAIDDDPNVTWDAVSPYSDFGAQYGYSGPRISDADLASDLQRVTGGSPPAPVPIGGPASGANQTVSGNGVTIALAAGATATVSGNNDTVNASGSGSTINFGGTQEAASISSGTVNFASGAGGTVTGTGDAVALTSNNTVTMSGTGDTATVAGTGNVLSTAGNQVALWNGSAATVQGDGNTVTLYNDARLAVSGQNDTVVVSGSRDTIVASSTEVEIGNASAAVTGDTNTVRLYGQATVSVAGSNDTVDVSGTGNVVSASSTAIDLSDHSAATATGDHDTATLHSHATLVMTGNGNAAHVAGTGNVLTTSSAAVDLWDNAAANVAGNANTVTLYNNATLGLSGQNDTVVVSGTGDTISASFTDVEMWHASAAVTGDGDTVRLYGQATVSLSGQGDTVDVSGTGNVVSGSSTQVNLSDGSAATATGNSNAFTLYNNATLGFSGSDDAIHVSGTGDSVSGSSGAIDLWNNAAATVSGDDDDITLYDNTRLAVSGRNDVVVLAGTGNQVTASSTEIELSGGSDAITGDYDTVRFYGQATVAASGTHETFAMAPTPASATISGFDATDTVQFSASTFANFNALLAHASQKGADTVIKTDATHGVTLAGVLLSSLKQGNFQYV